MYVNVAQVSSNKVGENVLQRTLDFAELLISNVMMFYLSALQIRSLFQPKHLHDNSKTMKQLFSDVIDVFS